MKDYMRTSCGNCGEKLANEFEQIFFSKFQQCPKCTNPTLVQSRSMEVQNEIDATPPVEGETIATEIGTPPEGTGVAPQIEVEMEDITIKLSENPAIAEVFEKESIAHEGDEVVISIPKTDLKLSDEVMAEILKEQIKKTEKVNITVNNDSSI